VPYNAQGHSPDALARFHGEGVLRTHAHEMAQVVGYRTANDRFSKAARRLGLRRGGGKMGEDHGVV
jgi:hypothetical protein